MSAIQQLRSVSELMLAAALLGAVFDTYNTITGASTWLRWLRPAADICFWLVAAGVVFFVLFTTDDGRLRLYTLPLLVIGYLLYRLWFHRQVVRSSFLVVRFISGVVHVVWRVVYVTAVWPVQQVLWVCKRVLVQVYRLMRLLEDGLFWVLSFWWKAMSRPLRRWDQPTEPFRKKIARTWEGILQEASKWIKGVSNHT